MHVAYVISVSKQPDAVDILISISHTRVLGLREVQSFADDHQITRD